MNSIIVLNFLRETGYQEQFKKTPISKQKVQYLGYELTPGENSLSIERKRAIIELRPPATKKQFQTFLGMAGFCHLWIPGFGVFGNLQYKATKGPNKSL